MKLTVLAVGSVRGFLAPAVGEYEERAARYWRFRVQEVEAGVGRRKADPDQIRQAEGERLLSRLPPEYEVVTLTRKGKPMSSRKLARMLQQRAVQSVSGIAFVIGGAYGLAEPVLARSAVRLSLSALTLPHEVARLVLAEQLYRAGTIIRNEPYHKGP